MAKTIYNCGTADLLPPAMANDPKTAAICAAMDAEDQFVINAIDRVKVLSNVGQQSSDVTDLLAIEQQTPYYNQALPLETRRALVAGTGKLNSIKGTKAAVEQAVREAFGTCTVQEWFEYGGQPYCFRVLINDFPDSQAQMDEIKRAIAATQNARSNLDEVVIIAATSTVSMFTASTLSVALYINTVMQAPKQGVV